MNQDNFDREIDGDILKDLINQGHRGQELISNLEQMKKNISAAMDKLIDEAEKENMGAMSKEEFEKEIN